MTPSWQDLLWTLPSDLGWVWYALWGAIGAFAALTIFVVAIFGHPLNGMFICRVLFCIGLVLIPLAPLNSGLQPWIPAFYALSAIVGALSLAVDRCDRESEIITVGGAIMGKLQRIAAFLRRLTHRGHA